MLKGANERCGLSVPKGVTVRKVEHGDKDHEIARSSGFLTRTCPFPYPHLRALGRVPSEDTYGQRKGFDI